MAYDVTKVTRLGDLKTAMERVDDTFAKQTDVASLASAFKSGEVAGNTVKLYTSTDKSGTAAFTFDFPTEMFLDQTKTVFVDSFAWSAETYPDSTNPNLEGKPVMVLAVKGSDNSVVYSFVNMVALVDTYTAKTENKDASTTVTISGYEVDVKVNISEVAGNALEVKNDGLYVPTVNIGGKADKVVPSASGNFAGLDENGNLIDSGKKTSDFVSVESGKGLSSNDYTTEEKNKLAGIAEGAQVNTIETIKVGDTNVTGTNKAADVTSAVKAIKVDNATNADTVNSHSVNKDVPADAVFTDTTYTAATTTDAGLMSAADKTKLDGVVYATAGEVSDMLDEVFGSAQA